MAPRAANPLTASKRPRARRLPADERRSQILDKAVGLFAERAYSDVSTAELAQAAEIGEPTIYRHFPSKRDLYKAALDRSSIDILDQWRVLAERSSSPAQTLSELGRWYIDEMQQHPERLKLRHRSFSSNDPEIAEAARAHYRETFEFIAGLYEAARASGQLPESTDVRSQAWLFMSIGALVDQTEILGLREEMGLGDLLPLARVIHPRT